MGRDRKLQSELKAIAKRQKMLEEGVRYLRVYVSDTADEKARQSQALEVFERQMAALDRDLRKLNIEGEGLTSEPERIPERQA